MGEMQKGSGLASKHFIYFAKLRSLTPLLILDEFIYQLSILTAYYPYMNLQNFRINYSMDYG